MYEEQQQQEEIEETEKSLDGTSNVSFSTLNSLYIIVKEKARNA